MPHIAGITIGFAFMVGAVGLGLGTIFITYPVLQTILKYAGDRLSDLSRRGHIAMSGPATPDQDNARGPMTFWGAAMFQWVNVKGWVMVIGTITAYAGDCQLSLEHRHPGRAQPVAGVAVLRRPGRCSAARCGRS